MLKKLRLKFICVLMAVVTVLLCVIFGLVLRFTARSLEEQSLQQLTRAVQGPMKPGRPGEPMEQLNCFTVQKGPDGKLMAIGGEQFDLSDAQLLAALYEGAMAGETTGILESYNLRYLRQNGPHGESVAFTDISAQRQTLRNLCWNCLLIGVLSFALLLVASVFLARWAVRPVERAWEEQRQFVADASHELKTPLTVILTNAQLLESTPPDDPRTGQFTESILSMSRQMRTLVESLLELARVDNGGMYASGEVLDLSQTVSETVLPFDAVFFEAGLELQTRITPDIHVRGSSAHLRQVAEILLDNARKYATPGTQVCLILEESGRDCRLTVRNAGPAISPEDQKRIFQRFYRTDRVRTLSDSYGLGLPIAQSIVREHKGRIWVQSKAGYNSFFVQLPQTNIK